MAKAMEKKEVVIDQKQELPPTIEELQKECKVPHYVFAGVCQAMGWSVGKRISKVDFEKAVSSWLKSPMKGR